MNNQQVNNEMFIQVIDMNEEDRIIFLDHYPRYRVMWDRVQFYLNRRVNARMRNVETRFRRRRNMCMFRFNSGCNAG